MPAAWNGLCTDHLHSKWWDGELLKQLHWQRQYWNPHWIRVAAEDEAMHIGPWVAKKRRKAFGQARFAVADSPLQTVTPA